MDGFVFVVVIVLFSLLEGVLRKRKAGRMLPPGQSPEDESYEVTQEEAYLPPYDDDPSYDDQPSYDDRPSHDDRLADYHSPTERTAQSLGPSQVAPPVGPSESEALTKPLWEEVSGLAAGRSVVSPTSEQPATLVPRSEPTAVSRGPSREVQARPEHFVHRSHAGYGTDPSTRAASEQDGWDSRAQRLGADAGAVHALFASGDPHALRQAIILQEVLGPPAALRGDPYDP